VYMGRFLRWNSWDIFRDPTGMALYTFERVQDPSLQSIGFMSLFAVFFLFLYLTLYTFGHLLLERKTTEDDRTELSLAKVASDSTVTIEPTFARLANEVTQEKQ